ncbi:MAG: heme transporter CcmC [Nitrososphaeraceae archaeon]
MMRSQLKYTLLLGIVPVVVILYLNTIESAFGAEPGEYVIRQAETWALFYRMMVAAFIVGAVVQGTVLYVCWRYRESHKKNRINTPMEDNKL